MARLKDILRDQNGQVLVLTALVMTALLGFVALSIDVGLLFRAKRNLQIVADAAATAGALDYFNTASSESAIAAAKNAATANGVTNDFGGAVVTVTNPVTSGAHTGVGTVMVVIKQPNPTFFMRTFGRNSMTVAAKAVAGSVAGQACMYLMGPGTGLSITGNSTIQGIDATTGNVDTACGIYVNSNVDVKGGSNNINTAYVAAGGILTGNQNTNPAPVITGAPKETPPKNLLITAPSPSGTCGPPAGYTTSQAGTGQNKYTVYTVSLTGTVPSGACYGVGTATNTVLNLTIHDATLANGITVFNLGTAGSGGTLTIGSNVSGGSAAQGSSGVTLDIYTGNFSVNSTNNDNLYAPSDGASDPYNGVLLLEPSSNTGSINIQWGSASGKFVGIIDAPGANVSLQDNGGSALVTGLVVGSLTMGTGVLNLQNYNDVYSNSPMRTIALVE